MRYRRDGIVRAIPNYYTRLGAVGPSLFHDVKEPKKDGFSLRNLPTLTGRRRGAPFVIVMDTDGRFRSTYNVSSGSGVTSSANKAKGSCCVAQLTFD